MVILSLKPSSFTYCMLNHLYIFQKNHLKDQSTIKLTHLHLVRLMKGVQLTDQHHQSQKPMGKMDIFTQTLVRQRDLCHQ